MPGPVVFTSYYTDESNDNGFQWEFHCDRCRTTFRSPFEQNYFSRGRGALRVVRDLFGEQFRALDKVSNAAEDFSNNWGGQGSSTKDKAFVKAVEAVKQGFRLCGGCGSWVCTQVCWNEEVGQCTQCSPMVAHQIAKAQAEARGVQILEAAYQQDYVKNIDMGAPARVNCPTCNTPTTGGKFCGACGTSLAPSAHCTECGTPQAAGSVFCSNCGHRQ